MLTNFGADFYQELSELLDTRPMGRLDRVLNIIGYYCFLKNGFEISVVFGPGTYSDNHDDFDSMLRGTKKDFTTSTTAEIACFDSQHVMMTFEGGDTVRGYLSPQEVLDYALLIKELPAKEDLDAEFNIPLGGG